MAFHDHITSQNPLPAASLAERFFFRARGVLIELDAEGVILAASGNCRGIFEAACDEVVGKPFLDFLSNIKPRQFNNFLKTLIERKETLSQTRTYHLKHKLDDWLQVTFVVSDEDRKSHLIAYCGPSPAQDTFQEQLTRIEETAHLGRWRWEPGSHALYSRGMYSLLGFSMSSAEGGDLPAIMEIHPDDRRNFFDQGIKALHNDEPLNTVIRMRHRDGSYRMLKLHGYVERGIHGGADCLVGFAHDITTQMAAERASRELEERYNILSSSGTDIIGCFDRTSACTFMSPGVEKILGMTAEDCGGRNFIPHVHPADFEQSRVINQKILSGEIANGSYVLRMRHTQGHYVWLEITLTPDRIGDDGLPIGYICVGRDISERKRYELELMAERERAEVASRAKTRFLANMSHELRTPLNAIIGFSEMLETEMFGPLGSPRYKEYLTFIGQSGRLLLDLISDILDMSKIEAGKFSLNFESVDLPVVLDDCITLIQPRAVAKNITLDLALGECADLRIEADERAMKQITLNLLTNAVKFTREHGKITLSLQRSNDSVKLVFSDTGIGIAEEDILRLTRPFEQARSAATQAGEGAGLGLALVKSLVNLHGGEMAIESELGRGTTVSLMLPLRAASANNSDMSASDAA